MQLNYNNFIRWYTNEVKDDSINIPRLAVTQAKDYKPVFAVGEDFSFYMNLDVPFNDSEFNSLRLDLIGHGGVIVQNVAPLTKEDLGNGNYTIYCDGTLGAVGRGVWQFRIINTATSVVKCISNYIYVTTADLAAKTSVSVRYRNSRDAFNYKFANKEDFYLQLRLNIGLRDWTPEGNIQQYRAVSTGRLRNEKYELDKVVKLVTYYFDDAAHQAAAVLLSFDDIQINDKKYLAKGSYKTNTDENNYVSKGEMELFETEFSKINKYGIYTP
jgi:hypothetical protein